MESEQNRKTAASAAKIAANQKNAQQSTGPTSAIGKAHSSLNRKRRANPYRLRGSQLEAARRIEADLREDLAPMGGVQERYFARLVSMAVWELLIESAISSYIKDTAVKGKTDLISDANTDKYLLSLRPAVRAAEIRQQALKNAGSPAESQPLKKPRPRIPSRADVDRAVADGIAPAGQGGRLSELKHELRLVRRDFDLALKLFLGLQATRKAIGHVPLLPEG